MNKNYDWLITLVKVIGAGIPGTGPFLQALSEMESKEIKKRLSNLEDPISNLHSDIPKLSQLIYEKLKESNEPLLNFDNTFYQRYSKSLAILDKRNCIGINKAIGNRYPSSINLSDPSFIMYLCSIAEDDTKMDSLVELMENLEYGDSLDGKNIELDLPLPVIKAVFEIYDSKGFGVCSKTHGICLYRSIT